MLMYFEALLISKAASGRDAIEVIRALIRARDAR